MDDGSEDDSGGGKLLSFPNGKRLSPEDVGAPYVVAGSGQLSTQEPPDPTLVAEEVRERAGFVKKQELVRAFDEGRSASDVIDVLLKEIAEESAHLKWERRQASKAGKPTASYNVARIGALRNLAELLIKRKEAALAERLDLKSPRFQKIFNTIMEFFHESMEKSGVTPDVIDVVFQQMKADMLDWERRIDSD